MARTMQKFNSSLFILGLVMVMIVVCDDVKLVEGALSPSQCKQEQTLGVNACMGIVVGKAPSAACCVRVRVSHFECICPAVTPKIASLINIKQAINLLQVCGRKVPHHFKCGSLNFP